MVRDDRGDGTRHRGLRSQAGRSRRRREPCRMRALPDVPLRPVQPLRARAPARLQALRPYSPGGAGGVRGATGEGAPQNSRQRLRRGRRAHKSRCTHRARGPAHGSRPRGDGGDLRARPAGATHGAGRTRRGGVRGHRGRPGRAAPARRRDRFRQNGRLREGRPTGGDSRADRRRRHRPRLRVRRRPARGAAGTGGGQARGQGCATRPHRREERRDLNRRLDAQRGRPRGHSLEPQRVPGDDLAPLHRRDRRRPASYARLSSGARRRSVCRAARPHRDPTDSQALNAGRPDMTDADQARGGWEFRPSHRVIGPLDLVIQPPVTSGGLPVNLHFVFSDDGIYVPAVVMTPPGPGPFPAVICLHGGSGGLGASWLVDFAVNRGWLFDRLLQEGYAVVWTEGRKEIEYAYGTDIPAVLDHVDVINTFRYVRDLPFVDPDRVAFFGVSHGGELQMKIISELREGPAALVPSEPAVVEFLGLHIEGPREEWNLQFNADLTDDQIDLDRALERIEPISPDLPIFIL